MLSRILRCLVSFIIAGAPLFQSETLPESCCQYSNVSTNRFMVACPVKKVEVAERDSACTTKSVLPGHCCAARSCPGAQTLERGLDLSPSSMHITVTPV